MVQVDVYALIGVLGLMATAILWLAGLHWKQRGHEDLCAQRYAQIKTTHEELVKVSDTRHVENLARFDRLDTKLDRLLDRI
jgi:hypothetical protein